MKNTHHLLEIVRQQKSGKPVGICSICSANEYVIESALEYGKQQDSKILLEATSNQVNQYGGYTGMVPADFTKFVAGIAEKVGFPTNKIILGGDHLGPNPWKAEPAETAMEKAAVMVKDYVVAGFTKIHLDASMHLGDDEGAGKTALDPAIIAERTAVLCIAAEAGYQERLASNPDAVAPVYVIGTEVPVPGGTQGDDDSLQVTTPADFHETVRLSHEAFKKHGLNEAWERVVGVVVQPGVEFGDHSIHEYDRSKAAKLTAELDQYANLVFEGHSTDYQQPQALKEMVEDGVGILKVGPELTFVMREAVFLLSHIEEELLQNRNVELSNIRAVLETEMINAPDNWAPYYTGEEWERAIARRYSLSDRIRYYWPNPKVSQALDTLIANLSDVEIPLGLLSQYLPRQYAKVRSNELTTDPQALIKDRIAEVYEKYFFATQPQ